MDQKVMNILIHASAFFAPILIPVIMVFISDRSEQKYLAIEALLFHLILSALLTVSAILSFLLIGIPFLILFGIVYLVYPIKGILYAAKEKEFHYPIIGRWISG
ncbi:MAG: DUF4870 domain-containing protein [Bacillaceae bacterium]|nr:DUF4870 domain-containing protein [Bacillaceae bacterium]